MLPRARYEAWSRVPRSDRPRHPRLSRCDHRATFREHRATERDPTKADHRADVARERIGRPSTAANDLPATAAASRIGQRSRVTKMMTAEFTSASEDRPSVLGTRTLADVGVLCGFTFLTVALSYT